MSNNYKDKEEEKEIIQPRFGMHRGPPMMGSGKSKLEHPRRELWKWLFSYLGRYKLKFLTFLILLLVGTLINSVSPTIKNVLLDEVVPGNHINLLFMPTIMTAAGKLALDVMVDAERSQKGQYILIVEGSVPENGFGDVGRPPTIPAGKHSGPRRIGHSKGIGLDKVVLVQLDAQQVGQLLCATPRGQADGQHGQIHRLTPHQNGVFRILIPDDRPLLFVLGDLGHTPPYKVDLVLALCPGHIFLEALAGRP